MARGALGGTDHQFPRVLAENRLDGLRLAHVTLRRGSAVGVDVVDISQIQSAGFQGHSHAARRAFAARRRCGEVMRVRRVAVTGNFAINLRAAFFGVFQLHQHSRAFAHHEAIAVLVKRTGRVLGIIVARAHGLHRAKPGDAHGNDCRFRAAGEHDVRVAHLDGAPGFADGVVGGRAGGAGGEIRPAQIEIHRDQARRHVADKHWDREGRDPAWAALQQRIVLVRRGGQAADAGAENHTNFIPVFRLQRQS